jgi:ribulose 1,5-bisphosphate synthetase/thiazole synthase
MSGEDTSPSWDCIIVAAGPAGLNAALGLGRAYGGSPPQSRP